jgi:hypothetical protein
MGTKEELDNPKAFAVKKFLEIPKNRGYAPYINRFDDVELQLKAIEEIKEIQKNRENRKGMAVEGGLPFSSESILPRQNKGGLPKKPKFMKGGSYKGKSHMYAAGGMVKELKI